VQSSTALQLEAVEKGDDLNLQLNIGDSSFAVEGKNLGGKFSGLMEVRDELVPSLKEDLDYTAYQMAQEVNKLHEAGEGLDGSSGIPFFQNPGRHQSQAYPAKDTPLVTDGEIKITVDGTEQTVNFAAGSHTLEDVASAIDSVSGISASTRELDDGSFVLDITPDYETSNNSYLSLDFDMSGLNTAPGQSTPEFGMPNFADLMTMAVKDPSKVAAGETSAPGDNRMALEIAALKDKHAVNGEDTFVSFYGKMAARVGIEASQNRLEQSGAQDSLTQLQNMRDGAAGVSLEEEMIALVKYQRGFEASAKLLTTVDDMMGTVISIKR
jgi:flagellar hook-associated protein 1 FlgK